jgi:hypothetical protein
MIFLPRQNLILKKVGFILESQIPKRFKGTAVSYVKKIFPERLSHLAIDKKREESMKLSLNSSLLEFQ